MQIKVMQVRAIDVQPGDVERHVSGQGRLMPWRRVTGIRPSDSPLFINFIYEGGDNLGASTRALGLVDVQREGS